MAPTPSYFVTKCIAFDASQREWGYVLGYCKAVEYKVREMATPALSPSGQNNTL
jgi:hypothetical protein